MDKALSESELLNLFDGKIKIVDYKELQTYNNLENLLYPYNKVIILYNTAPYYGHWCTFWKYNNTIQFFDSYGVFPDDQIKYAKKNMPNLYNEMPHLVYLLYKYDCPTFYNEFQFQKKANNINTCGRWVYYRLLNYELDEYEFYNLFKNIKDKDKKIVELTNYI